MTTDCSTQMSWYNKENLKKLYWEERMSLRDIADKYDISKTSTVLHHMKKHEIPRRDSVDAMREKFSTRGPKITIDSGGHTGFLVQHKNERFWLAVHRLTMVAEYGFDEVCGKVVHHKNEIPWDNRPENLKLMNDSEHRSHHSSQRTIEDNNLTRDELGRLTAQ